MSDICLESCVNFAYTVKISSELHLIWLCWSFQIIYKSCNENIVKFESEVILLTIECTLKRLSIAKKDS